jgi:hypothetical protein
MISLRFGSGLSDSSLEPIVDSVESLLNTDDDDDTDDAGSVACIDVVELAFVVDTCVST